MNLFHAFVNKILPGCQEAAQSTRVFHPLMNCSFVLRKIPLWCCLMVPLLARVLHPFMNWSIVLCNIPLWNCLMVTLFARVLHPLHELLFCVGQDSPLKLPHCHIARMCIVGLYFMSTILNQCNFRHTYSKSAQNTAAIPYKGVSSPCPLIPGPKRMSCRPIFYVY